LSIAAGGAAALGELVHDALKVRKLDKKICNMSKKMSEKET